MAYSDGYIGPARAELPALGFVLLVLVGLPLGVMAYRGLEMNRAPGRVIEISGRLPTDEQGGWTPETIVVNKGEQVRLRVTSQDVVHGFAIPKLGIDSQWIEPGKVTEIAFAADRVGRYAFLCTVWCTAGHWRMRGTLEVVDPSDPSAFVGEIDPPQIDWVATGLDLDAERVTQFVPKSRPNAANGDSLWEAASTKPITESLSGVSMTQISPSDAYELLENGAVGVAGLGELSAADRWDIVAHLWRSRTTAEALATGRRLYERDCTGCHGMEGKGDGPGADDLRAAGKLQGDDMRSAPVDFSDFEGQASASDLHYYAKLVRGGMGTGMPYWGTIYTEDELWGVIATLRSMFFEFGAAED
jgi:cytochrome c oxidase subunit 2